MQQRPQPCRHSREQTDMRARDREDMHDPRDGKGLHELRPDAVVATKEHGKDGRRILTGHYLRHAPGIMLPHRNEPALDAQPQAIHALRFHSRHLHARLTRTARCRNAITSEQHHGINLPRVLIAVGRTDFALRHKTVADTHRCRLFFRLCAAGIDIQPTRRAFFLSLLFYAVTARLCLLRFFGITFAAACCRPALLWHPHGLGVDGVAHVPLPLLVLRDAWLLPHYACDCHLLPLPVADIRDRQLPHRRKAHGSQQDKQGEKRQPGKAALPPQQPHCRAKDQHEPCRQRRQRHRRPAPQADSARIAGQHPREEFLLPLSDRQACHLHPPYAPTS